MRGESRVTCGRLGALESSLSLTKRDAAILLNQDSEQVIHEPTKYRHKAREVLLYPDREPLHLHNADNRRAEQARRDGWRIRLRARQGKIHHSAGRPHRWP